jgi:hypothetical protein
MTSLVSTIQPPCSLLKLALFKHLVELPAVRELVHSGEREGKGRRLLWLWHLGFGRIIASEIVAPNKLVNLV